LQIVRRHRVDDATAYLLEESGDVSAAFNILLGSAREQLKKLNEMTGDYTVSQMNMTARFSNENCAVCWFVSMET